MGKNGPNLTYGICLKAPLQQQSYHRKGIKKSKISESNGVKILHIKDISYKNYITLQVDKLIPDIIYSPYYRADFFPRKIKK